MVEKKKRIKLSRFFIKEILILGFLVAFGHKKKKQAPKSGMESTKICLLFLPKISLFHVWKS